MRKFSCVQRGLSLVLFTTIITNCFGLSAEAENLNQPSHHVGVKLTPSQALSKVSKILKNKGISKLPSTSSLVNESSSSSSYQSLDYSTQATSGTPPKLIVIPNSTIKNLFWRSGVVDGVASGRPTPEQCREFFSSDTDGESSGLGSCQMAEGVGHAFETLLDSETSLCYMKSLPTTANYESGGIKLVRGKFPSNDITELFSPGSKTRMVKVNTRAVRAGDPTEHIFIKIPSKTENTNENYLYRAELYFCPDGKPGPRGYNLIHVATTGELSIIIGNSADPFGGGSHSITVKGYLTPSSGSIIWDNTQNRSATLDVIRNTDMFKAQFSITADNLIALKNKNTFYNPSNQQVINKTYSVSRFTGSTVNDVSFLEGGYIGEDSFDSNSRTFSGAAEYRDTFYASAPANELLSSVQNYDLSNDQFYTTDPMVTVDTSEYSCSAKADIEITMKDNSTLEKSLKPCFHKKFNNMEFCRNDPTVQQARKNFIQSCVINRPPGDGPG